VWEYLYVPQGVFERLSGNTVAELARMCTPALAELIEAEDFEKAYPLFASVTRTDERPPEAAAVVDEATLAALPPRYREAAEQAIEIFQFLRTKKTRFSPVFTPLLGSIDEASRGVLKRHLAGDVPAAPDERDRWFRPDDLSSLKPGTARDMEDLGHYLKKILVDDAGLSPVGTLRSALDYACNSKFTLGGVFESLRKRFGGAKVLFESVQKVNSFRNKYIAHQVKDLMDADLSEENLKIWVATLNALTLA